MNVWNDNFEQQWDRLADGLSYKKQREFNRRRLARVKFAQQYRGYLLSANSNVGTGGVNSIAVALTKPLTFPALVIGCDSLTARFSEIEITRSNPSRTQFSLAFLWYNHNTTANLGNLLALGPPVAETPWLYPFGLEINELLRVKIRQAVAVSAPERNSDQGVVFRVIGLNKQPCPPAHWQDLERYIANEPYQYPVYLPAYTLDARTVAFNGISGAPGDKRIRVVTREVKQPTLISGFSYLIPFFAQGVGDDQLTKPKLRIVSSDGHSFTPEPVLWGALWRFSGFNPSGPGGGWRFYYELPVPHYLPQGGSIAIEITDATVDADTRNVEEIVFRGLTV